MLNSANLFFILSLLSPDKTQGRNCPPPGRVKNQTAVKYNGLQASGLKRVTFDILMVLLVRRGVAVYSPGEVFPRGGGYQQRK